MDESSDNESSEFSDEEGSSSDIDSELQDTVWGNGFI